MSHWLGYVAFGFAFAGFISMFLFRAYVVGMVFLLLGAMAGILTLTG